jgi:hypothetical protein
VDFPAGGTVVGFVHTHAYAVGENVLNCSWQIVPYQGKASSADIKMGLTLGNQLGLGGAPLPGYVIHGNGIHEFAKESPTQDFSRCGY